MCGEIFCCNNEGGDGEGEKGEEAARMEGEGGSTGEGGRSGSRCVGEVVDWVGSGWEAVGVREK